MKTTTDSKHLDQFIQLMDQLSRRHDVGNVFGDFLTMAICGYHQINIQTQLKEQDEANEQLYMEVVKKYEKEDINVFPKLLGVLQLNVLDDPYSDILGEYYTMHITKGQNGQYFTPNVITDFMASITAVEEIKYKRILDPACGSGRMLLSAAKKNPENFFFGADNNHTCAKMTVLNFFLNGLQGEVAWMDSLAMKWYGGWHINTEGLGIKPIEKEQSQIWSPAPSNPTTKRAPELPGNHPRQGNQLTIF